tara:strand:+ start:2047 stop:5013 length:2967 start_codon:yes stop_codon:yes gene_type:complete
MVDGFSIFQLAIPACHKAGALIFQKFGRLRHIADSIEGIANDAAVKKAIEDFEVVKGTWRGEFDVTVDKFLRAFEVSGLNRVLFTDALLGNRTESIRSAFVTLFVKETGQSEENAMLLYNQIAVSFEITALHLTKDRAMADIIKSSYQSLSADIERLSDAIAGIGSGIKNRPNSEEIGELIPKILRAAVNQFKQIRVETNQGRKDVDISKIYISPRLSVRQIEEVRPLIKSASEIITSENDSVSRENLKYHLQHASTSLEEELLESKFDEILSLSRSVILGNPGGGKSTLLQSICFQTAFESLNQYAESSDHSIIVLPIRVVLRDFERARLTNTQLTLFDYIINDLLNSVTADRALLSKLIENYLCTGQILLAFDGLDEILKTANRRQFVDLVTSFADQFPLCRVYVTSREVGYDKAALPSDQFEELTLGDFLDSDVQLYAENFSRYVTRMKVAEARIAAEKFIAQTTNNASDLRKNPLMLGLMMWIFNIRQDVPSNRPEIYKECARLMFERWDKERGIIVELPQTFDRLQVFSYIASKVFVDDELSGGVTAEWIESETRQHLCQVLESQSQAYKAASALMQFIVDRSGVMSEKGEDVFTFTHQTFLEYFFAKHIHDSFDSVSEVFESLLPHIREEEWDVVSRLALQIITHRNRRREDELTELLVDAITVPDIPSGEKTALVAFAARCFEFLIGSEASIRILIETVLQSIRTLYTDNPVDAMAAVPLLFQAAQERREFVHDVIGDFLKSTFLNGDEEDKNFVLAFVDGRVGAYGVSPSELIECRSCPVEMVKRYRGLIMEPLLHISEDEPSAARVLFEWTGTLQMSALRKFGLDYVRFSRPPAFIEIDGFSGLALAASGKFKKLFDSTNFTKQKAENSLIILGQYWRETYQDPILVHDRLVRLYNPPAETWRTLISSAKAVIDLRLGIIFAFLSEKNNLGMGEDLTQRERTLVERQLRKIAASMKRSGDTDAERIVLKGIENYFQASG